MNHRSLITDHRSPFLGYFRRPALTHHAPVGDRPGSRDKGLDDPVEQDQEREQDHRAEDGESDPARRCPPAAIPRSITSPRLPRITCQLRLKAAPKSSSSTTSATWVIIT